MEQFRRELGDQAHRLTEAEQRISDFEDELHQTQFPDKVEDLENCFWRNILHIISLPETYNTGFLTDLCPIHIPKALGLHEKCVVEWAHRLGALSNERKSPRPIIVWFLNYGDRSAILQSFHNLCSLQIDGHKFLIFADYSPKVSCRHKSFQPICSALHQRGIKFTLAYPAILHFHPPEWRKMIDIYIHFR